MSKYDSIELKKAEQTKLKNGDSKMAHLTKKQGEVLEQIKNGLVVIIAPAINFIATPYSIDPNPQYRTIQALRDKDLVKFKINQVWSKNKNENWYQVFVK